MDVNEAKKRAIMALEEMKREAEKYEKQARMYDEPNWQWWQNLAERKAAKIDRFIELLKISPDEESQEAKILDTIIKAAL